MLNEKYRSMTRVEIKSSCIRIEISTRVSSRNTLVSFGHSFQEKVSGQKSINETFDDNFTNGPSTRIISFPMSGLSVCTTARPRATRRCVSPRRWRERRRRDRHRSRKLPRRSPEGTTAVVGPSRFGFHRHRRELNLEVTGAAS